jgi:hypothetical protein
MKTNKTNKNIQKKFENRTFEPSASAWERLSVQLDEQPKQKKIGWFFYIGAAASILLLVSVGIQLFSNNSEEITPKEEVVIKQIDRDLIDEKIEKLKIEIPLEEAIVTKDRVEVAQEKTVINVFAKEERLKQSLSTEDNKLSKNYIKKEKIIIAKVEEKPNIISIEMEKFQTKNSSEEIKKKILKQDPNSKIKINADDLLYAVTHTTKEVKEYYAKYNVNREDILKTIKSELKKSNVKVNPNTILAEVERTIGDDDFQNNFMKSLKRRVSDIASAIASRND